jgi:hypothetical protein
VGASAASSCRRSRHGAEKAGMESFILTAGELALALAGVASCVALVCLIAWMVRWLFRVLASAHLALKSMSVLDDPTDRPTIGGGVRKW